MFIIMSMVKETWHKIWQFISLFLISLAIVIPIRHFIIQPFLVKGESMAPNFSNYDYLFVERVAYYFREPARGEVIVFRFPRNEREYYIKRLIGLPGEEVFIKNGIVNVKIGGRGKEIGLEERYLPPGVVTAGNIDIRLGHDEYFVLGDNRGASSDSRSWGVLPRKDIIGRVFLRLWPPLRVEAFWKTELHKFE